MKILRNWEKIEKKIAENLQIYCKIIAKFDQKNIKKLKFIRENFEILKKNLMKIKENFKKIEEFLKKKFIKN